MMGMFVKTNVGMLPKGFCLVGRDPTERFRVFGVFALLLCLPRLAEAQAELRIDSSHVETGNPFVLHLRLPAALGRPDSLDFSAWQTSLPVQNIISQSVWQTEGAFFSKTLTALFFEEDSLQLPPLPIALPNGDTAYSNPLDFVVTATPSPDDLNDMAPIKDIHREPTLWIDYLPWVLGGLLVLGVLGLLYWLANRQPKTRLQSRTIEIPAHELALKKLEVLKGKKLIFNGLIKEHYAELTFILREYLEKRFDVPALESTTEETLRFLKKQDFPPQLSNALQTLMEQADLAKFAKIIPPESFHAEALETAREIILDTQKLSNLSLPDSPNTSA